ncbi:LysM domain protein [Nonlabens dokdonensis DSW-6]|uniref:LysM domain protein n=2 Tax=Nonlabens dokdonensis TaxID=328515 RepID=L7WC21_NONDD|nr:LysM domain protein [Nonlabens dokdonensis DSW-6]
MCLAFAKAEATILQNYRQHTVAQGETIYTLTQKYKVTSKQLLELNPDLSSGLRYGQVLLIPAQNKVLTQRRIKKYKKHRVRRKETLYSLAKKYEITELDIKEANKELYSNPLKKGDRIQIPVFEEVELTVVEPNKEEVPAIEVPLEDGKYKVKQGEGMYGIATKFGIKVLDLKKLNPNIGDLKPGMVLNVPKSNAVQNEGELIGQDGNDTQIDNQKLIEYTIPKKMGMYSLKKLTGISEDSLIQWNPKLKDGLKEGMKIIYPNPNYGKEVVKVPTKVNSNKIASLVDSLNNFERQRLAIMLPFSLQKIDGENTDRDNLKQDRAMRIALDFYSGVKIAIDSANTMGIPVDHDIFDTQKSLQATKNILDATDFADYNTVIGPLISTNVVETAKELKSFNTPVVSPLTSTDVRLYRNLFQARPEEEVLKNKLKEYLIEYAKGKNVIIVTDNNNQELKNEFTTILPAANVLVPNAKKNYIFSIEYIKQLKPDVENVIVLAVDNVGFITDAVTNYSAKTDTHKITMFGLGNYEEMELSNIRLSKLNYVFPQMFKESVDTNSFIEKYYSIHQITPNSYATRGFDITLDIILRQASASDLYESAMKNGKTVMTENKFDYSKKFLAGFYNDAVYLLQYQEDLSIKELDINNLKVDTEE